MKLRESTKKHIKTRENYYKSLKTHEKIVIVEMIGDIQNQFKKT